MGLEAWGPSGLHSIVVNTQCHTTTTSKLRARSVSMTGSRSDVAATGAELTINTVTHGPAANKDAHDVVLNLTGVRASANTHITASAPVAARVPPP